MSADAPSGAPRACAATAAVPGRLTHGQVSARHATVLGQDHLPELQAARPESAGRRLKVVLPHAVEPFPVARGDLVPMPFDVGAPGHEGRVVVLPEAMQVFQDEQAVAGAAELA